MTRLNELAAQLQEEAPATRKMLERVPHDKLDWRPHERSMTMGRLAGLVADMFGWFVFTVGQDELDFAKGYDYPRDLAGSELAAFMDKRLRESLDVIAAADDSSLGDRWVMRRGEQIFTETNKGQITRQTLLHLAHHRGQLAVYLRLCDIPVPAIYGPSADESSM